MHDIIVIRPGEFTNSWAFVLNPNVGFQSFGWFQELVLLSQMVRKIYFSPNWFSDLKLVLVRNAGSVLSTFRTATESSTNEKNSQLLLFRRNFNHMTT